jgi:hypothetical protein
MIHLENAFAATDVLNQLLHMLCRGLPAYAAELNPWMIPEHESLRQALADLDADRRLLANRTAQAIFKRGGHLAPGPFPLEYTGLNDVSLEYLAREVIGSLQVDIEVLREFSTRLSDDPRLHALVEEILGNTVGHAEILEEKMKHGV